MLNQGMPIGGCQLNDSSEYVYVDEAFSDGASEQEDRQAGFYFSSSDN